MDPTIGHWPGHLRLILTRVRCSVVIPTRGRIERLEECLEALARQSAGSGSFEVLIGVDGPDSGESDLADRVLGPRVPHRTFAAPEMRGPGATRNTLIDQAESDTLLFLNDDVVPTWDLVSRHIDAQSRLRAASRYRHGAMVLGSAPWRLEKPDRVVDRMVRETSAVFFYDQMNGELARDPDYDWGFRHAWTLNLSLPRDAARQIGGFNEGLGAAAYEDLELGWRLREAFAMPVLYRAGAMAEHVHRYDPETLLRREVVLGYEGFRLAERSPACAAEVFGRDLREPGCLMLARAFLAGERREAAHALRAWREIAAQDSDVLGDDARLIGAVFALYRAARRYLRHAGHATAADGGTLEDALEWLEGVGAQE
jgi:GT2 family glycosyltransferase